MDARNASRTWTRSESTCSNTVDERVLLQLRQRTRSATAMARDCNDYVDKLTVDHPTASPDSHTCPAGHPASIDEIERSVTQLGLKGAMIGDHVNGRTYDDPVFLPLWKACEELGAMLLIHQGGPTIVSPRSSKYHLPNTIGNHADRAVTYAAFVYGGVMDACPDLRICLSHGGGYTCFGIGRMDRGWQVRPEARGNISQPPSAYLNRFYYDTISQRGCVRTSSTGALTRPVVDWPYECAFDWPSMDHAREPERQ